jgi:hypothetical protein
VSRADVLDGSDEVEKVRPFGVGERLGADRARAAFRNRGEDQRAGADGGQPVRVAVDVGELGTAYLMVMEDRVNLAADDPEAVAPEKGARLVAAVRQETGRPAVIAPSPIAAASESTRSASIWWPQSCASLIPQHAGERAIRCTELRGRPPSRPTPLAITGED